MRRFQAVGPSIVVALTAALTLVAGPIAVRQLLSARTATQAMLAQNRLDGGDNILEQISRAKRDIAQAVEPSVVYIEAATRGNRLAPRGGRSNGSGWVYDDEGHIVTNAHVVLSSQNIRVQFHDGRVRDAVVVGLDESTDIAVLKVDPTPGLLMPARRATGEPPMQGDMVFAFGSPFGFKFSMSEGIISGLGRRASTTLTGPMGYTNYIQTDAAINPGNSGGPLADARGRVIGMNTAIITDPDRARTDSADDRGVSGGIGFAIPLDTIESVVNQVINRGFVLKGYLGVYLGELNFEAAEAAGFEERGGVVITGVQQGMPADIAGLEQYDIITAVNGRPTPNMTVLRSRISNREPGETIRIEVWRNGEELRVPVTLAAAQVVGQSLEPLSLEQTMELRDEEAAFAHVVTAMARFGVLEFDDADSGGVEVERVRDGSAAAQIGFEPGMRIVEVEGDSVGSREALLSRLAKRMLADGGRVAPVTVVSPGGERGRLQLAIGE